MTILLPRSGDQVPTLDWMSRRAGYYVVFSLRAWRGYVGWQARLNLIYIIRLSKLADLPRSNNWLNHSVHSSNKSKASGGPIQAW